MAAKKHLRQWLEWQWLCVLGELLLNLLYKLKISLSVTLKIS